MGTITNPDILTNSQTVSFDSTSADNYYSFTMNESGNILVSGNDINGYDIQLKIYDDEFNYIDYYNRSSSSSISLDNSGTYYIQAIDSNGGSFSISSTSMSGTTISATPISNAETVSFDSTSADNYYSFTMNESGNILVSGNDINGYDIHLKIYDDEFNYIDYYNRSSSSSISLDNSGTYYIQAIDSNGGSFSIYSPAMSGSTIAVTSPIVEIPTTDISENTTPIENFVERFYTNVLERGSDEAGLQHWSSDLENSTKTADDIANGFFHSTEFINKNTTNSEFVDITYRTLLGREADSGGRTNWINALENGSTRDSILDGFIYSNEFNTLAQTYGIEVGTKTIESTPIVDTNNTQIENFVERFYTNVLERGSDEAGLQNWSSKLENSTQTADDIANGFFHSTEFINKNTTNSEFVDITYRTLLGREADSDGRTNWINALENGSTRDSILDGFIYSNEFNTLAQTYGIEVGTQVVEPEPIISTNSWDSIIGFYLFDSMDLSTPSGSTFHINSSDLGYSYMEISTDGTNEMYLSGNGISENITSQITSVSNDTIYMYFDNESDEIPYLFDGTTLTIHDSIDGYDATMDWLLQ